MNIKHVIIFDRQQIRDQKMCFCCFSRPIQSIFILHTDFALYPITLGITRHACCLRVYATTAIFSFMQQVNFIRQLNMIRHEISLFSLSLLFVHLEKHQFSMGNFCWQPILFYQRAKLLSFFYRHGQISIDKQNSFHFISAQKSTYFVLFFIDFLSKNL